MQNKTFCILNHTEVKMTLRFCVKYFIKLTMIIGEKLKHLYLQIILHFPSRYDYFLNCAKHVEMEIILIMSSIVITMQLFESNVIQWKW